MHSYERPSGTSRLRLVAESLFATALILIVFVQPAFAFNETPSGEPTSSYTEANCGGCHQPWNGGMALFEPSGVHGNYTTVTYMCKQCHAVHVSDQFGQKLLPGPTVKASCETCHDGTGGHGVYGTLSARGLTPGQTHDCDDGVNIVPGGDPLTGGDATMTFSAWSDGSLTCIDCHSVHASSVVASFTGDRKRGSMGGFHYSSKLLKQRPGNAATATPVYGSDWCLACHKGRNSQGGIHNHPVETSASAAPSAAFWYGNIAILAADTPTSTVTTGAMGTTNRGYLMPYPRVGPQVGHRPICMQCHEDTRYVGTLDTTGTIGDAATFTVTASDGTSSTNNPRFQNFPHETLNANFLIETNDDLCLNCHPTGGLP